MTFVRSGRLLILLILGTLISISALTYGASAQQSTQNKTIARGFQTRDTTIVPGALVSTLPKDTSSIEAAHSRSAQRLAGVASEAALIELSGNSDEEVQVIVDGTTQTLVSDINGPIKAGDKITASPIAGVGMKADTDAHIIGTARTDFDTTNGKQKTVTDKEKQEHSVRIGSVPVEVGITYYVAPSSQFVPPFLQSLADTIAGRPVSLMRILLSCLLLLLGFGSIFVLIYTSVRSGIISLGRNPLAATAIQRGLVGIIVTILLIAALSLLGTYLILTT